MALDDKTLNNIFNKQKKGAIDALRSLGEARSKLIHMDYEEPNLIPKTDVDSSNKSCDSTLETDKDRNQTVTKVLPNRNQSVSETVTKVLPNRNQSVINPEQTDGNCNQSVSTTVTKTVTKVLSNRNQSVINEAQQSTFSSLVGLQRAITLFIYESCKNNRSHTSEVLTLEHIAKPLNSSIKTIKTAIHRLVKKDCLIRAESKNGRGGWSRYLLPENIFQEILRSESVTKVLSNRNQSVSTTVTTTVTKPPSSSSLKDLKTTTTSELPSEWNFDISSFAKFGFTESHLKVLVSLNIISPSDVEQSLIEFSYDIENNSLPVIKTSKINFLMGLLRKGRLYVSEGFQKEQDAMIDEMARRAEGKRKKRLESEFGVWESQLSDDDRNQIEKIMPNSLIILYRTYGIEKNEVKNWMFNYFLNRKS